MIRQGCLFLILVFLINPQVEANVYSSVSDAYSPSIQLNTSIICNQVIGESSWQEGLVYFRARMEGEDVYLDWEIIGEIETSTFLLERKTPQTGFWTIGGIKEKEDKGNRRSYSFKDEMEDGMDAYRQYRLKQVFADGTFIYHQPITLRVEPTANNWAYPSPVQDYLNLQLPQTNASSYKVSIYNSAGSLLKHMEIPATPAQSSTQFVDMQSFSPGLLVIRVETGEEHLIQKIIKK